MCLKVTISDGNRELNTSGKNFKAMIFNLPRLQSKITGEIICIEATDTCKNSCYEKKINYPGALESRENNLKVSKTEKFVDLVKAEIDKKINAKKPIYFRIHESGDFYSEEYLSKWIKIANSYIGKNIKFMAYTKSIKLLDKYLKNNNININAINIKFIYSIMDDSNLKDIELAKSYSLMTYSALDINSVNMNQYTKKCIMGCSNCMYCYDNKSGDIITNLR